VTAGEDPAVAMSNVAVVHAIATSLANGRGASYAAFWDKLSDSIMSARKADSNGFLASGLYNPVNRKNRQEFDGNRVSLFANATIQVLGKTIQSIKNTPSVVMQHEIMHALHASGLLMDILGPDGIRALEDVIDGPLYDLDGNALIHKDYEETQERLAVVWEIFLATQKAPNAELQPAFDAAKNFFRTWLNYFLKMFETTFDVRLWEIERVGEGKAPFRLSDGNYDTYSAQSKKLLENKDAIAALYRLINAQPETEAHMATGGLTMATGALVTEMSDIVGMDMSGALDGEPVKKDWGNVGMALPVFPKDRKVTADELPDAAEASSTEWYHGSPIKGLHNTGLSSAFSNDGFAGTGLYMTDAPRLGNTYNRGDGDVYKVSVKVRKVINLEKPFPLDVTTTLMELARTMVPSKDLRGGDSGKMLKKFASILYESNDSATEKLQALINAINSFSGNDSTYKFLKRVESKLRESGYDAYTHIGGAGSKENHRVLVLLDPNSDFGNYPKTITRTDSTTNIEPKENVNTGWTPESGTAPTDDQMADMLGYSGMNTDDQGVKDALKHHKATTGVRLKVWAGPFLRKGGWGPREDKKKQKLALKIMEKAGSLRFSLDAAAWLQSVYDGWTAGRNNPAFNNEEIETNAVGVGTLMTEYARLWRKFIDEPHLNETMAAINKTLPYIGSASRRAIVDIWTGMTRKLVNVLDPVEKAVQDIGLPAVKHHINNMHSLTTWASKITERVPQYFDRTVGKLGDWVKILGSESWRSIDNDFLRWADAYYAKNEKQLPDKTSARFRVKAARDLKLWMLAQREIEIFENANKLVEKYLADKKAYDEANGPGSKSPAEVGKMIASKDKGPQPPKIPQISKAALALARNVVTVMKMTYGEDIHALDAISMRFSKWETDSKLVPLLKANMITAKQYNDIRTSGLRHVPLHRVKELVDATGALNPKIDGSMYEVLDYLKRDLSFKVEDPLAAAIASVQAINMLVQRQIAKNAIGEAIRDNVPVGSKHGEFVMLHSKKKISKEAYDKLPDEKRYSEKHKKHDPDGESGNAMVEEYYEIVPATKDDIDDILKKLREKMHFIKDKKKLKEAQITMNGAIFAAYLEPGVPTYFRITDATVAESFYMMNNPQALYSTHAFIKAMAATQRWFKGQYVTSPQFVFNMLFRDIPNAIIRSKHGLRTSDVVRGIVASLDMAGFESVNDYLDRKGKGQEISDDAIKGFGPFGGLISATGPGGNMDIDLLMAASHDGLNSKNASVIKQLWTSYTGNLKLHGVAFPTMKDVSEAFKKGDWGVAKDVVTLVPKMAFSLPRAIMSVPGNILEQAPRLAERRLMMDVNITRDFPMLLEKFPERYQPDGNGQVLAGYAGKLHRRKWEAAAERLKADANAVVAKEDLPIQYGGSPVSVAPYAASAA